MPAAPLAYSYVRFSSPGQAEGDSLRRQTETARAWCERNGVRLDGTTTLHDLKISGYTGEHRSNPDRHALALFLKLVESGLVPRGSYLILESLDRLTREHIQPALRLVLSLTEAGVRIVQLKPSEMVYDDKSDAMFVMMMIVELSRGHSESAMKSERVGKAWAEKKRLAREDGTPLTRCLPAWVEGSGGKLRLVPGRAAVVRRIVRLAAQGYGRKLTAALLAREGVPAFGPAGHWNASYIGSLLCDRRVLGEYQPRRRRDRGKDGEAIPNYYPRAVSDEEWYAARAGAEQRKHKRGRVGKRVNLFAGLARCAQDGSSYFCASAPPAHGRGVRRHLLLNTSAYEGRAPRRSFPYDTFEAAVLSCLKEIDPAEVLGGGEPDESLALAGELAGVEARIAELEAELLAGDVAALARVLRQLEARRGDLAGRLAQARQKAANPLGAAWGECKSLLAALDEAPDPEGARLRLRSVLRRVVSGMWLLVVARGHRRVAALQVWFSGEKKRDYLIVHQSARNNGKRSHPAAWWCRSLASVAAPGDLDLRRPEDAKELEAALLAANVGALV